MEQTTAKKHPANSVREYFTAHKFDLMEVVYEKNDVVIVAFGHKNSKHNELHYYNKRSETLKPLFIDGTHSFYEFITKTKLKYQKNQNTPSETPKQG